MTVKFLGEVLQDTDGYDQLKHYEDLFLTENVRASMLRQGIQSADLSWIRCNAEDKNSTGVYKVKKLNKVYGSKYRIPIDHGILNNHRAFYPKGLLNELIFELRLVPARDVVRGWDLTKLSNELTKVELENEVINNVHLANAVTSNCSSGERFMYEHVNHHSK